MPLPKSENINAPVAGTPSLSVKHGRLYTPFTSLKRELREFVVGRNGQPLVEIDMKSAQWVFLLKAMALSKKYNITEGLVQGIRPHLHEPIQLLEHFGRYSSTRALAMTVLEQDIYFEFTLLSKQQGYIIPEGWRASSEERSAMKEGLIGKVLYAYHTGATENSFTGLDPSELKLVEVFRETYEEAHAFMMQCAVESTARKTSGQISPSRDLAILMQEVEGGFFHGPLLEAIMDHWKGDAGFFILHDAIFIESDKAALVADILARAVKSELGVDMDFSVHLTREHHLHKHQLTEHPE